MCEVATARLLRRVISVLLIPEEERDEEEEEEEQPNFQPTAKIGAKKQKKLEEKQAKKAQREVRGPDTPVWCLHVVSHDNLQISEACC